MFSLNSRRPPFLNSLKIIALVFENQLLNNIAHKLEERTYIKLTGDGVLLVGRS